MDAVRACIRGDPAYALNENPFNKLGSIVAGIAVRKKFLLFIVDGLAELVFRKIHEIRIELSQSCFDNIVIRSIRWVRDIIIPGI